MLHFGSAPDLGVFTTTPPTAPGSTRSKSGSTRSSVISSLVAPSPQPPIYAANSRPTFVSIGATAVPSTGPIATPRTGSASMVP